MPLFHLAFPVDDLEAAKRFYVEGLGCSLGRHTPGSMIVNLAGHQLVAHLCRESQDRPRGVYPRHFGLVFETLSEWEAYRDQAVAAALEFYEQPKQRFSGHITEHRTFFLIDPAQNILEFKHYSHPEAIFEPQDFHQVGDVSPTSAN